MQPNHNTPQTSAYIESHVLRKYNIIRKVGSGAYGHVWKVEDRLSQKIYALKKIFDAFQHSTDAQRTFREIEILRQTQHPNIIRLVETIKAENNKDVYLVFQFMEADLHNVIGEGILKDVHIKYIIYQLTKALKYLHSGKIIHRDLKPSNILINSNCFIKLCDFGLVRSLSFGDESTAPTLTEGVATRWYRAPEVLLGSKSYSTPADIWSFGCIIYEIISQKPLFPGNSTIDQVDKILMFTGYPTEEDIISLNSETAQSMLKQSRISHSCQKVNILKDFDPSFADLLSRMIVFNPDKRITTEEILKHEAVQPFRKKEEQIQCKKQIRTSVDDNKKLSVEEYRNFIYGVRRSNTPNNYPKNDLVAKKSSSYAKLSSGSGPMRNNPQEREPKEKQTLKFARSAKDAIKSLHSYNKSAQLLSTQANNHSSTANTIIGSGISRQGQYAPKLNTGNINNINKSGPIINQKYYGSHQQIRHTLGAPPTTNFLNSPKTASLSNQIANRPIFKSSKYILSKNELAKKSSAQN